MWVRSLLFFVVVVGGLLIVIDQLSPDGGKPAPAEQAAEIARIRKVAARLNPASASINAALEEMWREASVEPTPVADDLTIARRMSLALVGTIPSLEEIRWLESLPDDVRLDLWADRLLSDRRWADYTAERLARALVGTETGPFLVYRRRRFVVWLADELYDGRAYDELARELVSAEGLWTDTPATNFLTVAINPVESQHPNEVKVAGRVARVFLGARIDCAECHDHPFDDWSQQDFHSLAAFFGEVKQTITGIHDGRREYLFDDGGRQEPEAIEPKVPFDEALLPVAGRLRHRLAYWITHPENSAFARATVNRMWALCLGRPLVEPVDNIPREGDLPPVLNRLAEDFVDYGFNMRRLLKLIARSEAFRIESRATEQPVGEPLADEEESQFVLVSEKAETEANEAGPASNEPPPVYDPADQLAAWAVFPVERLLPEQLARSVIQAASLKTINHSSHILVRTARFFDQNSFLERYGDPGEDELTEDSVTIAQRLLLMNGKLVREKVKSTLNNASGLVAELAPNDAKAVETAFLAVLTRHPSAAERSHFVDRLASGVRARKQVMEDLFWALINSAEFSWNH